MKHHHPNLNFNCLNNIYRSLYDIPIMVFAFDYSNVLLYSSIMIILILLCIMLVAFSALKEHV